MILMTLLTLGATCNPTFYEQGDFPPCPKSSPEEVIAIRSLGEHDDTKSVAPLLGRIAQFCAAYHKRIGYVRPE